MKKIIVPTVTLIAMAALLVGCGDNKNDPHEVNSTNTTEQVSNESSFAEDSDELTKSERDSFHIGDVIDDDGYQIEVTSVEIGDATGYEKAPDDKEYLVVNMTVKNESDKKRDFDPKEFKIEDSQGTVYESKVTPEGINNLAKTELEPKQDIKGTIVYEVKKDEHYKLKFDGKLLTHESIEIELNS